MRKLVRVLAVLLILFSLFLLIFSIFNKTLLENQFSHYLSSYGYFAIFAFAFFFELFPQYISAHYVLILSYFYGLNWLSVLILVCISSIIAGIIAFWLGRFLEESLLRDLVGKKQYKSLENGMKKWGKWYVALSAVSPLPYIPLIYGALDFDWKDFFIYGVFIRTLGFIITTLLILLGKSYIIGPILGYN